MSVEGSLSYQVVKHQLLDELGNHRRAFEIEIFDKGSDGVWRKTDVENTLGGNDVVLDTPGEGLKIYFRVGDSLLPANMDFNSPSCHRCFAIGKEIPVVHRITGNYVLGRATTQYGKEYQLCQQSYSDTPPFYYLRDTSGQFRVGHGSHDLKELLENLKEDFAKDSNMLEMFSQVKLPLSEIMQNAEARSSRSESTEISPKMDR